MQTPTQERLVGKPGTPQAYLRTESHLSNYGFIFRREYINPPYQLPNDCYLCHAPQCDTPSHLLYTCPHKKITQVRSKLKALVGEEIFKTLQYSIGTSKSPLSKYTSNYVMDTILYYFKELYKPRMKAKEELEEQNCSYQPIHYNIQL